MTKEKSTVPRLRFPGFTDAWKQRKLREVATFVKGNGYSKKDLVIEGSPIILYGRLYTKYETVISEVDTFVSVEDNKNSVVYSEGGEVLVPASGESSLDIARASVVAKKGIILGGDINIIRLHSEIFPVFLALTISNGKQQKGLSKRAQGKSVVHLHNSDLKKVDLDFPTLPEQEAIGNFFSDLDQLITLHQRKLDDVKELKKALLQKMFPKGNGNDFPELRFPEFKDAWKQRKLGEVVDVCSGRDYKHLEAGSVPVYGTGGYMLSVSEALSENVDAIGIGRKGTIDNPYILKAPFWTVDTLFYCLPKQGSILEFSYTIFQNINWRSMDESTGVPSLSKVRINNIKVLTPSLQEQEAIGSFFSDLDQLITLHQRQLDHLKLLKKALLQQMFI
ncbi:restriction endonuclease subunit S [Streptococcus suis]|uniref:restriction endonuclease subunit S n=1 Tax=Streptococcus suis TaxID=1307 RepID=UPI0014783CEB|nr:restriction endonuclease subunit S [Streptococcus suis]